MRFTDELKYAGKIAKHFVTVVGSDDDGMRQQARQMVVAEVAKHVCDRDENKRFDPVYQDLWRVAEKCGYTERGSTTPHGEFARLAGLENLLPD